MGPMGLAPQWVMARPVSVPQPPTGQQALGTERQALSLEPEPRARRAAAASLPLAELEL